MSEGQKLCDSPSREKYWVELTAEEKLERARQVIKMQEGSISRLEQNLQELKNRFEAHVHLENEIVYKRQNYYGEEVLNHRGIGRLGGKGENPNEVWF